jgi:hypothetical protein
MKKDMSSTVGSWAFLIGVLLAVILGFAGGSSTWTLVLVVIGLIIGFLNVTASETEPFLMSGAVLIIASSLGQTTLGAAAEWPWLEGILEALLAIFVPATIVVAIKNVFSLARN